MLTELYEFYHGNNYVGSVVFINDKATNATYCLHSWLGKSQAEIRMMASQSVPYLEMRFSGRVDTSPDPQ